MAIGLEKEEKLLRFFTAGLLHSDLVELKKNKSLNSKIKHCLPINFADRVFNKLKLDRLFHKSNWYTLRDSIFDFWVSQELKEWKANGNALPDVFVGWANASLESIKFCNRVGIRTVLECGSQHILEQQKILQSEFEKHGQPPIFISEQNINRMLEEYQRADKIAVPSSIVTESFAKHGLGSKLIKVPYGSNSLKLDNQSLGKKNTGNVNVLFAGQVSFQKGFYYLAQAWKNNFANNQTLELTIVGDINPECSDLVLELQVICKNVKVLGPLEHSKMANVYTLADIFILPSLQEGMAMVIGEAAKAGLAIICTRSSGWSDHLKNQESCLEIQEACESEIVLAIELLAKNREFRNLIAQNAGQIAKELSWELYTKKIIHEYENL